MADLDWMAWYEDFDQAYGPQQRRQWYDRAAAAYRWARPVYPKALIDRVCAIARLSPGSTVLELGCGPGIATQRLAEKALQVCAIEPSPSACELARLSCAESKNITIVNSTFEDFKLPDERYDAVVAATSFHWISPAIACSKSAAALKPNGHLILLWATPPQLDRAHANAIQTVYDSHGLPELGLKQWQTGSYYQDNFELFAQRIADSGWFERTDVSLSETHSSYTPERYVALLSTLSDYIGLPEDKRQHLLSDLRDAVADLSNQTPLKLTHWFGAQVAPICAQAH